MNLRGIGWQKFHLMTFLHLADIFSIILSIENFPWDFLSKGCQTVNKEFSFDNEAPQSERTQL